MSLSELIQTAELYSSRAVLNTRAQVCFDKARAAMRRGETAYARDWALKSLRHSVGIASPVYRRAKAKSEHLQETNHEAS